MSIYNTLVTRSHAGDAWFFAGLTTSYPNIIASSSTVLSDSLPCQDSVALGCKVFHVPTTDSSQAVEVNVEDIQTAMFDGLREQVVVFKFKGQFYAVDHACPHSSYPLSQGTPFDIEDFGIQLSAGISCPKHNWSFDLVRGNGDRGNYRLKIWEVQFRPVARAKSESESETGGKEGEEEREVWVRRKQRMG